MSDAAAPVSAPVSAPSGGAPPPSGAGSSAPTSQPTASPPSGGEPVSAKPARTPHMVKHKAQIPGADGQPIDHEMELDISEHLANYKRKIKSNGSEREVTLAELEERFPLADGAFKAMRERAEYEKKHKALEESVKKHIERLGDPRSAREILAQRLGSPEKVRDFVEQWVNDLIADDKMTPEQREARARETDRERSFREREEKLQRAEREHAQRQKAAVEAEAKTLSARFAKEWPGHLERAGVKPTAHAVRLMATMLEEARANKYTMSEEQAAREVAREYGEHLGAQGQQLPVKREEQIQQLASVPGAGTIPRAPTGQFAPRAQEAPPATLEEYRARQMRDQEDAYQKRLRAKGR